MRCIIERLCVGLDEENCIHSNYTVESTEMKEIEGVGLRLSRPITLIRHGLSIYTEQIRSTLWNYPASRGLIIITIMNNKSIYGDMATADPVQRRRVHRIHRYFA